MPSSYSSNLLLELMADGENEGLWGEITNTNLEILGRAVSGVTTVTLSGTTHTLTVSQGALSEGHYSVLELGGSPTGTVTVTIDPNTVARTYVVKNSSGEDAVFTQGSGGDVTVANGETKIIYSDGAGASAAVTLVTNAFTDAEQSKLDGIETNADVTDTANVTAAGALMDSELTSEAAVKALDQGVATTDSPDFAGLTVDTDTLYVDSANNRVGIGTSSPSRPLHINSGLDNRTALFESTDDFTFIEFEDSTTANAPQVGCLGDALLLRTSFIEAMRIDSSGDVGIGTSSPVINAAGGKGIHISNSGAAASLHVERTDGADFEIISGASGAVLGTRDATPVQIKTNNSEAMRIDSSGNVGIGTSSPSKPLTVVGRAYVTSDLFAGDRNAAQTYSGGLTLSNQVQASSNTNGEAVGHTLTVSEGVNNRRAAFFLDDTNGVCGIQSTASSGVADFVVQMASSEAMRIDSSGRVGIGTSSPGGALHVDGGITRLSNTTTNWLDIDASSGAGNDVKVQTRFNSLIFDAPTGAGAPSIRFQTGSAEAMRIDSSGNLLVGTTVNGISDPGFVARGVGQVLVTADTRPLLVNKQGVNGTSVEFRKNEVVVGDISVTASTTSYNTSSDERLKENIADAQPASDLIDGIQVREFDWKADGEHQRYGMVAQELETVAPEAVTKGESEDDMWSVDYSKLVPMLVKEIQDLRKRVAELET